MSIATPAGDSLIPYHHDDQDLLTQFGRLPGLQEFLILRQAHALEHATVWVLNEMQAVATATPHYDDGQLGGLATDRGFYLYGVTVPEQLQHAVNRALRRLQSGDWSLAVHPRCGTNTFVTMVLSAGLMMGASLVLPRNPLAQLVGMGAAMATATQLSPEVGVWVQRHLTTAIPFNLRIDKIFPTVDLWGRSAHFIQVEWRDR